jgi:Flp pilus assembly pilin Flp
VKPKVPKLVQKRSSRRGITAVEYGLITSLVIVGIIVSLSTMSNEISNLLTYIGEIIGDQTAQIQGPAPN